MGCQEYVSEVVAFDRNRKRSLEVNCEIIFKKSILVGGMDRCKVSEAEAWSDSSKNSEKVSVARTRMHYIQDYICIVFSKAGGS